MNRSTHKLKQMSQLSSNKTLILLELDLFLIDRCVWEEIEKNTGFLNGYKLQLLVENTGSE